MRLIFSFDTEEYETPGVDDAVLYWAETLTRHGCRGAFCLVGEKARVLRERGRKDILDALADHEIDYHSDWHSRHPLHAEYLDTMDWENGVERVVREELPGIRDIEEILGERPFAYCKPGSSWAPQVAYAMLQMGLPVFCDAPFEWDLGQPMWYCGQLFLGYHTGFDRYFETPNRLATMKADFRALADRIGDGTLVMYTHPVRLFTTAFTDNFRWGRNPDKSEWKPAPMRSRTQIETLQRDFDAFVAHVVAEGIEVIDYRQLYDEYREEPTWLDLDDLRALAIAAQGPLEPIDLGEIVLSPAEAFGCLVYALARHRLDGTLPRETPVRRLLGPTERLRYDAFSGPVPVDVLIAPLLDLDESLTRARRIPNAVVVDRRAVPPGGYLKAIAQLVEAILRAADGEALPEAVPLETAWEWPAFAKRPELADAEFGWSMFYPGFVGSRVLEMARLQAWTAKPARRR